MEGTHPPSQVFSIVDNLRTAHLALPLAFLQENRGVLERPFREVRRTGWSGLHQGFSIPKPPQRHHRPLNGTQIRVPEGERADSFVLDNEKVL